MIEVEHLSKSYGGFEAVRDVSFAVSAGEVVGFLGPNGAGKSTTLRILAGFLGASAGRVRIAGFDVADEPLRAKEKLGYMPEAVPLYPEMRALEYLHFRAELKRLPRRTRRESAASALRAAGAGDVASVPIGELSKGYRQRVGLADALLGDPPLLILDEPTAGLDPNQIREVRTLIRALGERHTVLLSTHILSEVEATCSRAIVIAKGRLVAEGSIAELRAKARATGLVVAFRGDPEVAAARARTVKGVKSAEAATTDGELGRLSLRLKAGVEAGAAAERVVAALVGAKVGVREVAPLSASLEQVFVELTAAESERETERGADA